MFTVVAAPDRHPHKCISCGGIDTEDRKWWFDFGEDVDTPGPLMNTIYLCSLCATAAAKEMGLVDQEPLLRRARELEDELFDYKTKAEALEQGLDGLLRARFVDPDDPAARELVGRMEVADSAAGAAREGDVGSQAGPSPTADELGDAAREGAEPSDGSGLADVLEHISFDAGERS